VPSAYALQHAGYLLSRGNVRCGMSSTEREQTTPELDQLIAELADHLGRQHRPVIEQAIVRAYALGYHSAAERIRAQIREMHRTKN
jgi:hypothetical protein